MINKYYRFPGQTTAIQLEKEGAINNVLHIKAKWYQDKIKF